MTPRESLSAWRARQRVTEATVDAAVAEVAAERNAQWEKARQSSLAAEGERKLLSRGDLLGADLVRTKLGWHRVVRVNQKTVTVDTGYSWTAVIRFDKILEARVLGGES